MMQYYAPGKLMISGEYAVLNGAKALAIPTNGFGQNLQVNKHQQCGHYWESIDTSGKWFEATFSNDLQQITSSSNHLQAHLIQKLLQFIQRQKPELFEQTKYFKTHLNFDRFWGFGSSSSLIGILSKWSGIPAFDLLNISFGGSGYDVAVAMENKPILYQLSKTKQLNRQVYKNKYPVWQTVDFKPDFASEIFLIYRNIKQNSRDEIKKYQQKKPHPEQIRLITQISETLLTCQNLDEFENLIIKHEQIISQILQRPMVQHEFFSDYPGKIKSLGAWGGDFILATRQQAPAYFKSKGYHKILCLKDILG